MEISDDVSKVLEPVLLDQASVFFSRFGVIFSSILLVAVNILPLYGIFYWGWSPGSIIVLYWLETLVVGIFSVIKLKIANQKEGVLLIVFIYSFVLFVCGVFLLILSPFIFHAESIGDGISLMMSAARVAVISAIAMLISHTYSFLTNFIIGKEWQRFDLSNFMQSAETRIVLLMVVVITALLTLSAGYFYVIALVSFKTFMDLGKHLSSHSIAYKSLIKTRLGMIVMGIISLTFVLTYVAIVFWLFLNTMQ